MSCVLIEFTKQTKSLDKRITLAKMARQIGVGGQSVVAKIFGVSRNTIKKGQQELEAYGGILGALSGEGHPGVLPALS